MLGVLYLFAWWARVQGDPSPLRMRDSPAPGAAGGGGWGGEPAQAPPPHFGPLSPETTRRGPLGPRSPRGAQIFFGG